MKYRQEHSGVFVCVCELLRVFVCVIVFVWLSVCVCTLGMIHVFPHPYVLNSDNIYSNREFEIVSCLCQ